MTARDPTAETIFPEYVALLLRRHHLLLDGQDTTAATEKIERRLLELWPSLDDDQRRTLTGAAADLNWVRRGGRPLPGEKKPGQVTDQERLQLVKAEAKKDWHAVLHSLRVCAAVISAGELAGCRATAYALLGMPEIAEVFRQFGQTKGEG